MECERGALSSLKAALAGLVPILDFINLSVFNAKLMIKFSGRFFFESTMAPYQKKYYPVRKLLFFFGEGLLIFFSVLFVLLSFSNWEALALFPEEYILRSIVVTVVFQLTLYFYDLYDLRGARNSFESFIVMTQAFGVGCIMLAFLYLLFPSIIISTSIFWKIYIVICSSLFLWRSLYHLILENKWFSKTIILVGAGEIAAKIAYEINRNKESGFIIGAVIGNNNPAFNIKDAVFKQTLNQIEDDPKIARADRIVVALDDRRGSMPIAALLQKK